MNTVSLPEDLEQNENKIVELLTEWNQQYRNGTPVVDDEFYDLWTEKLREINPDHPFLHTVESDNISNDKVHHGNEPMLSTEKAYDMKAFQKWINRIKKAAGENNVDLGDIEIKITPKLDGLAGKDINDIFATRGDGQIGSNITYAFERGLIPIGGRNLGVGEIILSQSYFEKNLKENFDHPRNVAVGIIKADTLKEHAIKALKDGAVHFVPYSQLDCWTGSITELEIEAKDALQKIKQKLKSNTDYALDGFVAEITHDELKNIMGSTNHHHRWQIALKDKGDVAEAIVKEIIWQTGRTGKVTPVIKIESVFLSGANISSITAHHAGMVKNHNLGKGAIIKIVRAGEVIPKFESILNEGEDAITPHECPSCNGSLTWKNDFLLCESITCDAKAKGSVEHFFDIIQHADGFGTKTIEKLHSLNIKTIEKIFDLDKKTLIELGFTDGIASNLSRNIKETLNQQIPDWQFLAAFGIEKLGRGDSKNLLKHFTLSELLEVEASDIEKVKGFAKISSNAIHKGIQEKKTSILYLIEKGFNLIPTLKKDGSEQISSPISGVNILFTGSLKSGSRNELQNQAETLGATIQKSISKKTNIVVIGENAGASKITLINKLNDAGADIKMINEDEWLDLIKK